jgi:cephalosporin hydroxylase
MSSVRSDIWQTSRWLRLYDWDWESDWPTTMTADAAQLRARTLPRRFYYHPLQVVSPGVAEDGTDTVIRYVETTEPAQVVLNAGREPRSIAGLIDIAHAASKVSRGAILSTVQALIRAGMIVAADDPEPIDPAAVFGAARALYGCFQHPGEIAAAIAFVHGVRPKTVLEIGTAWGGSLFCWAQAADPEAALISLDLPGGVGGRGHSPAFMQHFQRFCFEGQTLLGLSGDSHEPSMLAETRKALSDRPVDFLFIDGDHSYAGVRADFESYSPLVAAGGVVMFHDTHSSGSPDIEQPNEVIAFWNEVKGDYRHQEFVGGPGGDAVGIGALFLD